MRNNRLYLALLLLVALFASCKKSHYDLSNIQGINAEGEVLLPLASKTISMMDMMERFEMTDEVNWSESGDLFFKFSYANDGVINGAELLKFDDLNIDENYAFNNPYPITPPPFDDTVVSFENTITFESNDVHVLWAQMKSGRLDFTLESNMGSVQHAVIQSSNIKDADGNDFELNTPVYDNTFGFNLDGLQYVTEEPNTLNLSFELRVNVHQTSDLECNFEVKISGVDLGFKVMRGYVDSYSSRNSIDSVFTLFPNNLQGVLEVEGVRISVSECNTFGLDAQLVVDTALFINEGQPPYSILESLPLTVDLPSQLQLDVVFNQRINGKVDVGGGRVLSTSTFIVNPGGVSELVTVSDTCHIDTEIGVEIPFSFRVDDISYLDTVNMDLANLEMPEMIENLTLELTFVSTMPINMNASFFMYNSVNDRITDTLLVNAEMIKASDDGSPVSTHLTVNIDENRVGSVLHSDRIIMSYQLDSNMHKVVLNKDQKLSLFLKLKAKYNNDEV